MTGVLDRCVIRTYLLSQQFDQGFFMVWQSLWFYSHRWAYVSCICIRYGFYCHQTRVTFIFSLLFWLFPSSYLLFCDLLHLNSSADQKPFLCLFFFWSNEMQNVHFFLLFKVKIISWWICNATCNIRYMIYNWETIYGYSAFIDHVVNSYLLFFLVSIFQPPIQT